MQQNDSSDDIRLKADRFLYKTTALCHDFDSQAPLMLELPNRTTSANISGIEMSVADCFSNIKLRKNKSLGYERETLVVSYIFSVVDRFQCAVEPSEMYFLSRIVLILLSYRKYAVDLCNCSSKPK